MLEIEKPTHYLIADEMYKGQKIELMPSTSQIKIFLSTKAINFVKYMILLKKMKYKRLISKEADSNFMAFANKRCFKIKTSETEHFYFDEITIDLTNKGIFYFEKNCFFSLDYQYIYALLILSNYKICELKQKNKRKIMEFYYHLFHNLYRINSKKIQQNGAVVPFVDFFFIHNTNLIFDNNKEKFNNHPIKQASADGSCIEIYNVLHVLKNKKCRNKILNYAKILNKNINEF